MTSPLAAKDVAPLSEMNTTPLIDVMLVLLIMFIITIPIQTHAVKLDLPKDGVPQTLLHPVKNKIIVTRGGAVLWNGTPVSLATLRRNLDLTQAMSPTPELQLQPEAEARYELVDQVLAMTKQARVAKMGFVGNEAYRNF